MVFAIVGHAVQPRDRRLPLDRRGTDPRHGHRLPDGHVGADDRDAAANRASATVRRARRHAGRRRRVPSDSRRHACRASTMAALGFEVLFGAITVAGSIMAFGKLQELITAKPVTYPGQNSVNIAALLGMRSPVRASSIVDPAIAMAFYTMIGAWRSVRHHHGDADRRRGHAGGGLAAQLVRRPRRRARPASRSATTC